MAEFFTWLQGLSAPLQIILVVVLALVFKDDMWKWFKKKLPGYEASDEGIAEKSSKDWFDEIVGMMGTLETNHIAHVQGTADQILENQKAVIKSLESMSASQRDILEILRAFKEYGINCRTK